MFKIEFPPLLLELFVKPFIRFNADELNVNPLSKLLDDDELLNIFPLPKIDDELLVAVDDDVNESSVNVPMGKLLLLFVLLVIKRGAGDDVSPLPTC